VKRQRLQVALDSLCGQEVEAKGSTHSAGLWRWRSDHTASRSITHLPSSPSLRANGVKPTRAKANTDETNVIVGIVMRRQDLGGLEPWAELVGTGGAKETEKPLAALPSSARQYEKPVNSKLASCVIMAPAYTPWAHPNPNRKRSRLTI
jgi:hypothetical protein